MRLSRRGLASWSPVREALAVAVAIAVAYLLFCTPERFVIGAYNDDGAYVALGRAILSGDGYRAIYLSGSPFERMYPPGVPLVFAVAWWLGGTLPRVQVIIFAFNVLAVAGAAGAIWWLGRARLELGRLELAAFAVGPFLLDAALQYYAVPLSEPYFVLGWASALVLYGVVANRARSGGLGRAIALGAVLAATTFIRTQGVVLIAAFAVPLLIEPSHRRHGIATALAALVPLGAWQLVAARGAAVSTTPHPGMGSYISKIPFGDPIELGRFVGATFVDNVSGYAGILGDQVAFARGLGISLLLVVAVLVAVGAIREAKRRPALVGGTLATTAVVLLWPFTIDRLMLSLLPFAGLLAASAVRAGLSRTRVTGLRAAAYALIGLGAAVVAWRQIDIRRETRNALRTGATLDYFSAGAVLAANSRFIATTSRSVHANTSPDDRILSYLPAGIFLHTGRRGVMSRPPQGRGAQSVFARPGGYLAGRIVEHDVSIVVLGNVYAPIARDVQVVARRCPGVLQRLRGSVNALPIIYRVRGGDSCLERRILRAALSLGAAPDSFASTAAAVSRTAPPQLVNRSEK